MSETRSFCAAPEKAAEFLWSIASHRNIIENGFSERIGEAAQELDTLRAENQRLQIVRNAAQNLIDQRGRYNTEIAYKRLEEALKGTP